MSGVVSADYAWLAMNVECVRLVHLHKHRHLPKSLTPYHVGDLRYQALEVALIKRILLKPPKIARVPLWDSLLCANLIGLSSTNVHVNTRTILTVTLLLGRMRLVAHLPTLANLKLVGPLRHQTLVRNALSMVQFLLLQHVRHHLRNHYVFILLGLRYSLVLPARARALVVARA